ncbi:MAG: hypothetical protein LBC87_03570 [Fibromonadaceae bacterium]|jgi:hypothetical protein|nr:hypothetical protein [Fibromonadaceae bacterium]
MASIKQKANLTLIAALCTLLFSCDTEFLESWEFWKKSSLVVAEVGNSRLYLQELKETKTAKDTVSREEWVRRIESWVDFEVMYREALKRGLQKDPTTQKLIKDAEKKILVDRLKITMYDAFDTESDKEMQEFYENNKEMFRIDSASFLPFTKALPRIKSIILAEKQVKKEKKWLAEVKNNYSIEVYPQYLDSL